jgi:exopolysaccharide biosynthesis polyprenyl glycosylphosphotransferase
MAAPDFAAQNIYAETAAVLRDVRPMPSIARLTAAIVLAETVADFLTSLIGFVASYWLYGFWSDSLPGQQLFNQAIPIGAGFGLLLASLRYREDAYRQDGGVLKIRETERIIRVTLQSLALTQVLSILFQAQLSAFVSIQAAILIPALLMIQKNAFLKTVAWLRERYRADLRVIVFGTGESGRNIASTLLHSPRLGLKPIAIIEDRTGQHSSMLPVMGYRGRGTLPVVAGDVTPESLRSLHADLLLIATARLTQEHIAAVKDAAMLAGLAVGSLSSPPLEETSCVQSVKIDGLVFSVPAEPTEQRIYISAKRIVDLALTTVLLIILAPLLFAIALLIRVDSPGPALFIQKRVGKNGAIFRMYKFRTMYASTPKYELSPTSSKDWRITNIGRCLRRTSLDELPQLINVLLGDMSLVGPRPEMPFIVQHYTNEECRRLEAVPGITGLWQLSADRAFPIHQNIQYDLYYIRNRSFSMDVAILAHTLVFALRGGI